MWPHPQVSVAWASMPATEAAALQAQSAAVQATHKQLQGSQSAVHLRLPPPAQAPRRTTWRRAAPWCTPPCPAFCSRPSAPTRCRRARWCCPSTWHCASRWAASRHAACRRCPCFLWLIGASQARAVRWCWLRGIRVADHGLTDEHMSLLPPMRCCWVADLAALAITAWMPVSADAPPSPPVAPQPCRSAPPCCAITGAAGQPLLSLLLI